MTENPDPKSLITRARALCEAATPGPWCVEPRDLNLGDNAPGAQDFYIVPVLDDEPALAIVPWPTGVKSDAEFIAAAPTLVPELADALEAKERELVDTRERKLFCRRQLEALKVRACDAVGMPSTTDCHSVGDRIEMLIKALKRERDKALAECERLRKEHRP